MGNAFFHLMFLNGRGVLAQKLYMAHATFRQFSDVKMGDDTNNLVPLVSWLPVNFSALELAVLRKANLIF